MRIIVILFMALPFNNVIKAQQKPIAKEIVEQVQAIVAFEMNVVSLCDFDTTMQKDFINRAGSACTVEKVKQCLPKNVVRKNGQLCDDIQKIKREFFSDDHLTTYFSDSIFFQPEGKSMKEFIEKRKDDEINQLKGKIEARIKDLLNTNRPSFEQPIEKEQEIPVNDNCSNSHSTKGSLIELTTSLVGVIIKLSGYLLALLIGVVAVILFRHARCWENVCHKLRFDITRNERLLQKRNDELQELQNVINQLKRQNVSLEEQNRVLREDVENLENARRKQIQRNSSTVILDASCREESQQFSPREYFLGVPQNGKFSEGSEIYRPGKALYKVISTDGVLGEFEYINKPEAIGYAKQSRTNFLESACNIIDENKQDFMQIETRQKGKVERVSDGWRIIKKADVYLV